MLHFLENKADDINSNFYTSTDTVEVLSNNNSTTNNCIYKEIFEYNVYNKVSRMEIKKDNIVIDIGAHIGIYSRYAAVCGAKKIIAFEMNPIHFVCLRQNVREQDDVFNCVILDKNLSKFKLENGVLVNGFDLKHFYDGGLFDQIDFMKVDITGKELDLLLNIQNIIYDSINKISVKCYNMSNENKIFLIAFLKSKGFYFYHNIIVPYQPIQFLYFWK